MTGVVRARVVAGRVVVAIEADLRIGEGIVAATEAAIAVETAAASVPT